MAINIQEILHPSDSDAIKFEKINYNFDQIVANGGGPSGQKGSQGIQGTKGNTGSKGQKGDVGPQGLTGATTSPWHVINVNPDSANETYSILKPKITTDNLHPTIFLGDQTFNENTPADGWTTLRATLTIGKHAQGVQGGLDSDEYLRLWHGADNNGKNVSIDISSSDEADNSVKYTFGKSFDLDAAVNVEFNAAFNRFSIADNSSFKVPANNTLSPDTGLIRYNSSTNVFQGGISDGTNITWVDFCMAPCGQGGGGYTINIEPDGDLLVNQYGTPYTSIDPSIGLTPPTESYEYDNTGNDWAGVQVTTTTQAPVTTTQAPTNYTISFENPNVLTGLSNAGGGIELFIQTGPVDNLIFSASDITSKPSWITFDASVAGSIDITVEANTSYSARSGSLSIKHPQDPNTIGTISVSQNAVPATTTQAPATTTQAPATTQAPLPEYTASMAGLSVSDGVEGSTTQWTWAQNGPSVVTFNPSIMVEGSETYSLVLTVPSGYSNAGAQVVAQDTAVGTPVYKISYDPNGGTLGSGSTGIPDQTGTHPLSVYANTAYVRDGYTFDSWNTSYMGTGTVYSTGDQPPISAYTGVDGIYDKLNLWARWNIVATTTQTPATTQAPPLCNEYTVTSSYTNECNILQWRDCDGTVQMSSPIGQVHPGCPGYGTPSMTICHEVDYDLFPGGPTWSSGNGTITFEGTCS